MLLKKKIEAVGESQRHATTRFFLICFLLVDLKLLVLQQSLFQQEVELSMPHTQEA